jgi:hypothetical protein
VGQTRRVEIRALHDPVRDAGAMRSRRAPESPRRLLRFVIVCTVWGDLFKAFSACVFSRSLTVAVAVPRA